MNDKVKLDMFVRHGLYIVEKVKTKSHEEYEALAKQSENSVVIYDDGNNRSCIYTARTDITKEDLSLALQEEQWRCIKTIRNIVIAAFSIAVAGAVIYALTLIL